MKAAEFRTAFTVRLGIGVKFCHFAKRMAIEEHRKRSVGPFRRFFNLADHEIQCRWIESSRDEQLRRNVGSFAFLIRTVMQKGGICSEDDAERGQVLLPAIGAWQSRRQGN